MYYFDLLFAPVMILFPLLFAVCFRRARGVNLNAARIRGLTLLLIAGSVAALAAFAFVRWQWGPTHARYLAALFFPLWFGVAGPLAIAKNPNLHAHHPQPAARTATLARRDWQNPVPGWWTGLLWAVWAALFLVVLARLARPLEGNEWTTWWAGFFGAAINVIGPLVTPYSVRRSIVEPEPMDAAGTPRLAEAYARSRSFRAWGLAVGGLVMVLVLGAMPVLLAWLPLDGRGGAMLGIVGGIAGTALGIAGGVFGTVASLRRARVTALLRELESGPPRAAV